MPAETRTMYLHTFDDQPASIQRDAKLGVWLAFAGGRHKALLVPTLERIRREQQECIAAEWQRWTAFSPEHRGERPSLDRYGYVLVEVPRV